METLAQLFSIQTVAFSVGSYPVSYIELLGTLLGLASVLWAVVASVHTWTSGVANAVVFFYLYYQVQLYSDMLLQIYFLGNSIYGWWRWAKGLRPDNLLTIGYMPPAARRKWLIALLLATVLQGWLMSRVHVWWPSVFRTAAAFAYADALTTLLSMGAMWLMAQKRVESWVLWIVVDLVSIYLYLQKGIVLVAVEYLLFLGLATAGLLHWIKRSDGSARLGTR